MFAADGGGWVVAEVKRSGNTHFEMQLRAAARSRVDSTRPPQLKHKSVSPTEMKSGGRDLCVTAPLWAASIAAVGCTGRSSPLHALPLGAASLAAVGCTTLPLAAASRSLKPNRIIIRDPRLHST